MKKRAVGYIRVSGIEQTKGSSLDSQRMAIQKCAKENGWSLGEIYADEGISGADMEKREGLLRLLRDAAHGKFDIMICADIDRFGRDMRDALNNRHILAQSGVEEHFISGPTDDDFIKNIKAAVAQQEREKIKERTMRGRYMKLKQGSPQGHLPFNRHYDRKTGEWSIKDEYVRKRILWAAKEYLKGKSMGEIASELTNEGIKISTSNLYTVLAKKCGDRYTNTLKGVVDGKEIDVSYEHKIPEILPQQLIEEIRERMEQRRCNRDKRKRYVLNNFIFCADCGKSLTGQTLGVYKYYTHPHRKDERCRPGYKLLPGSGIEKAVFKTIFRNTIDVESFRKAVAEQAPDDTKINSIKANIKYNEKELKKIEKELDKLVKIALNEILTPETIKKTEEVLLTRKKNTTTELETDRKNLKSMPRLKDFEKQVKEIRYKLVKRFQSEEHLEKMTFDQKRRLLEYLFDGKDQEGKHYGIYVWMKKKISKHKKHFHFDVYAQIFAGRGGFYTRDPDGFDFHERMDKRMAEYSKKLGRKFDDKSAKKPKRQLKKRNNKYKINLSSVASS